VDRGQACVAGAHGVAPFALEVVEERPDDRGVEVGQVQRGRRLGGLTLK
jgi:hypothetical protein